MSTLKLRSHSGKEVANKKSELERLADHFNIDVDNPVNVMTQDHSRAFLQSQKPRDKYKLFVKATLLGEVQDSLKFVRTNKDTMKALIEKKEGDVPALERRKKDLDDELAAFEELGKQEARKRDIVKKMGWAHVAEAEAEAAAVEAELATFRDVLIPKAAKKEAKYRGELDDAGGRRDEEQRKLDEFAASIHATAEERSAAMAAKTASQRVEARAKAKAADAKRELEDLRRRAANLSTLAHTARETQAKETQAEVGAAEKEVARCQAAAEAAKAARDAAQADDDARASAAGDARRAADAAAATVTDVAREEREAHDAVRRLTASQSNSLAMFGDRMPQLVAELRSPKGAALFSAPPVGPLGAHITLKDPRWGVAAEQAIGSMLTTFLVANTVDGKALAQLAKSFGVHDAKVIATSRLGATSVYAVRTPDGTTFPTLFSLLNAAPPCVMNALSASLRQRFFFLLFPSLAHTNTLPTHPPVLPSTPVDEASVEAILLAPSFEEAREAAEGKRGVSAAYTQEGFRHEGADGVTFMARASNKARGPPRLGRDTAAALADAKQRLSEVAAAKAKAEAAAAAAAAAARAAEAGARRGGAVAAAQAALRACLSDLHEAQRAAVAARSGGGAGAGGGLGDAEAEHLEGQLAEVIAEAEAQQAKATAEEVAAKEAAVKAAEAAKVAEEKQRTAALVQQESDALTAAFKEAAAAVRAATEKLVQYSGKKREFEDKCGEKEAELRGKRRAVDAAAAAASAVCTRDEANAVAVGAGGGAPSAEKLAALLKQADIRIEKEKGRNKRARDDVEAEADAASTELKRLKRAIGCAKEPLQRIVKCFDTRYQLLKDTSAKMRTSISNLFNNHRAKPGGGGVSAPWLTRALPAPLQSQWRRAATRAASTCRTTRARPTWWCS